MTEQWMAEQIAEAVKASETIGDNVQSADSFDEAGVMTNAGGFVLKMDNGREFQVTVVRSK